MKHLNMYKFIIMAFLLALTTAVVADDDDDDHDHYSSHSVAREKQVSKTPQQVLERLKSGNERFVAGKMKNRNLLAQANKTAGAQFPLAVVLSCMDSRTPPELIFDQGIGAIFATRIAGNIQNDDIVGSMEYATKVAGVKLIVVLGHTNCGAINGACKQVKLGHLTGLLQKIQPAVEQAVKEKKSHDCADAAFINQIAKDNVLRVIKQIQTHSAVISDLIKQGKVGIIGGIQDLATGKVTFFEEQSIMSPSVTPLGSTQSSLPIPAALFRPRGPSFSTVFLVFRMDPAIKPREFVRDG